MGGWFGGLFDDVDNDLLSAGLLVTGQLLGGLFTADANAELNKGQLDLARDKFDYEKEENARLAEERAREREIKLQLEAINARMKAGAVKPNTEPLSLAAQRTQTGSQIESNNLANLIQGYIGALK